MKKYYSLIIIMFILCFDVLHGFDLPYLIANDDKANVFFKSYFNSNDIWEFYEIGVPARISENNNKFYWHLVFVASKNYEKCIVFFNSNSQHNLIGKLTSDEFHIISKQINLRLISNNNHKKYSDIRGMNQPFYLRICNKKYANIVYGDTANPETYMWAKQLYYYFNQFVPQKDRLLYQIGEEKTFEENMFEICGIKFTRL